MTNDLSDNTEKSSLMNAAAFRRAIEKLNLTQAGAAALVGRPCLAEVGGRRLRRAAG
jgi:hypothetical protein